MRHDIIQLLLHGCEKPISQCFATFTEIPIQDFIHISLNCRMKLQIHRFNEGSWMHERNSV